MIEKKLAKKIHIIGSCVTRDIFRVLKKDHLVGQYAARSSLISRVSPPLKISLDSNLVSLNSNWQRKMVSQDFDKTGICPDKYDKDILIIDFVDERLNLWKIGNTYITQSTELVKLDIKKMLKPDAVLSRGSQEDFDLWVIACHKFAEIIPEKIKKKTILHKAFWANQYLRNDQIENFEDQEQINFFNQKLLYYYDTFQSIYKPEKTIEIKSDQLIADANHKWNLAPFHYTHEYYKQSWNEIMNFQTLCSGST
jgi:hypothetical protein